MEDIGPAIDDEVVLAWLQAEIRSSRFRQHFLGPNPTSEQLAMVDRLIYRPDLLSAQENAARKHALSTVRGFGRGVYIFRGLANDLTWRRVRFTPEEVGQMLYANNVEPWLRLAPSLRVVEGAQRVREMQPPDDYAHIIQMADDIQRANAPVAFPEIICLHRPDNEVSVMEGHSRATVVVMEAGHYPDGIEAYLGTGPSVATWFYL